MRGWTSRAPYARVDPLSAQYNIAPMTILALETVTRRGSLAWRDNSGVRAITGATERTHGERLPGEVISFLAASGHTLADIDLFAVVSGPGSFTGLRVGIAAAQGLAFAARRPVLGIPTLDALATAWHHHDPAPALIVACLDGQRGDVFYAAWRAIAGNGTTSFEASAAVIAPSVGGGPEAAAAIASLRGEDPVVIVGSGGLRHPEAFEQLCDVRIVDAPTPIAAAAAILAAARIGQAGAPHALQPLYLRRPDALIARERSTR